MKKPTIAIVDYGMGNLRSVQKALEKAGAAAIVTRSSSDIRNANGTVLPGVGAFGEAVRRLRRGGLWNAVESVLGSDRPFLGICLGLQLLFERSEEARGQKGFGLFKGPVIGFRKSEVGALKVPHMGWNELAYSSGANGWFNGIPTGERFYFVHSFFPEPNDPSIVAAKTRYGRTFCSAVAEGNLFASQFHPEKSGAQGLRLLRNFVRKAAA